MKVSVQHAGRLASPNSAAADRRSLQSCASPSCITGLLHIAAANVWSKRWPVFPQADLFAGSRSRGNAGILARSIAQNDFSQKFPGSRRWHRHFLLLYRLARSIDRAITIWCSAPSLAPPKAATRAELPRSPSPFANATSLDSIIATGTERRSAACRGHLHVGQCYLRMRDAAFRPCGSSRSQFGKRCFEDPQARSTG